MQANKYILQTKVLWSQIDSNNHLRHSAYADFAAQARVEAFNQIGISLDEMHRLGIGPVLFKEELIYKREVHPNDVIGVTCQLSYARKNAGKWSFKQFIYRGDGVLAAEINVQGAWLNLKTRKLTIPPEIIAQALFLLMPKSEDCILEGD